MFGRAILLVLVTAGIGAGMPPSTKKLIERTLFKADAQTYRYTQGSVLSLNGKRELLMAVSVFGGQGGDMSDALIKVWPSHDGGLTWVEAESKVIQRNIGRTNVKNPSFLRLSPKTLLFFFGVGNNRLDEGPWFRRSEDNAKTWSEPIRMPYDGYGGLAGNQAILLKRGRILVPCYVTRDSGVTAYSYAFYSDDLGYTWKKSNEFTVKSTGKGAKAKSAAEEPSVVELKDGGLLMFVRTYSGFFFKSTSADGGATWSEPVNSGVPAPGSMPVLARIPGTANVLLLYNYGEPQEIYGAVPRNRIASAISRDGGKNFSSIRILDGGTDFDGKMTMPNVAFVGKNAVVSYSKVKLSDVPRGQSSNHYSWMLQVMPVQWFYEGDATRSYGEDYLKKAGN